MKREYILVFGSIIVFGFIVLAVVLFMGCLPAPSSSTPAKVTTTATDDAQNKRLDDLTNQLATVKGQTGGVSQDTFNTLQTKVNTIESNLNNKAATSDLNSLQSKITALEDKVKILEDNGTSSTGTSTSTTGNVVVSIYSISPSMIYNSGEYTIFLEIANNNTAVKKIFITGTLSPNVMTADINTASTNCTGTALTYFTEVPSVAFSPSSGVNCQLMFVTTPQILIAGGAKLLIPIRFNLAHTTSDMAIWTPTFGATIIP